MTPLATCHFKSITYKASLPGPRLIITGAVHGDETCGTAAILRAMQVIDAGQVCIGSGQVTFIPVANPTAFKHHLRFADRNLNRGLSPKAEPRDEEDHVANWLCPLLAEHDVLLDLHSFDAAGEPFVMVGPNNNKGELEPFHLADEERALARHLGVGRAVDGWLATYAAGVASRMRGSETNCIDTVTQYGVGTTEFMRRFGGYAVTLECGQHDDPRSVEVAYKAIINTLAFLGMDSTLKPAARCENIEYLSMRFVVDRISPEDYFPDSWSSFDRVSEGEIIGIRANGTPVLSPIDGCILFPDKNAKPSHEWFYLAKKTAGSSVAEPRSA